MIWNDRLIMLRHIFWQKDSHLSDSKIHSLPAPDGDFTGQVEGEDFCQRFKATLSQKDMAILELRVEGYTYEEIADRLGYKTHSAVVKRMEAIKKRFIQYENETGR